MASKTTHFREAPCVCVLQVLHIHQHTQHIHFPQLQLALQSVERCVFFFFFKSF